MTTTITQNQTPKNQHAKPALPEGTEIRGFALYIGVDDVALAQDGTSIQTILNALRETLVKVSPTAQSHATVAIAPLGTGGTNIDVTRLALGEPAARAKRKQTQDEANTAKTGVVIDIPRHIVRIDDLSIALTEREYDLLAELVLNPGRIFSRNDLVNRLWHATAQGVPNERTVDVLIKRVRNKLAQYGNIIRTARGIGYRFDSHPDVKIIK